METIKGRIKNYVFHNQENSYSIARLVTEDNKSVTLVGYFPVVSEDILYAFQGDWVTHTTYGEQFKVESFKKTEEHSIQGLISYLSSPLFHGIGEKTAHRMVEVLGPDLINHIMRDKSVLKAVGLSPIRIEKFYQQLLENQTHEHILVALYGYQIAGKTAMKLLNRYQMMTLEKIEENPYQLIDDIEGIGFIKADEIAFKVGIQKEDPRRIQAAILYTFDYLAYQNGDLFLHLETLKEETEKVLKQACDIDSIIQKLIEENRVVEEEGRYYLAEFYYAELKLAQDIKRIRSHQRSEDARYIETLIDAIEIQKAISYTAVQKEAMLSALTSSLSVITGGPGTGKTTIIDGLLEAYRSYHKIPHHMMSQKVALMAPTGRAAKRMKELLNMDAKTIHRHLGYNYDGMFKYDERMQMPYQLIIMDETSMVDLFLAKKLFGAIKTETQVIVVGDHDQLPSVGPGQFLFDLIDSKQVPVVYLNEIHRQAKDSHIIQISRAVNEQRLRYEDLTSGGDLFLVKNHPDQIAATMIKQIQGAISEGYDLIEDIQVLAPMYKGSLGIDNLNLLMQATFNPNPQTCVTYGEKKYCTGDKVIQLINDPERMIMNGDVGVIKEIRVSATNETIIKITFDDQDVYFDRSDLENVNLAYAISIHKSQGSEYKIVLLPLVKSYLNMLKKELIYTAMTRAKNYLIVLGDMQLLLYAANHLSEKRSTTLSLRLKEDGETEAELSPYDFL